VGLRACPVKFLSVVGEVSSKVPQLAVKLNVPGDAGDLTSLTARLRINPASTGEVLLSNVVGGPKVDLVVLYTASGAHLIDGSLVRVLPTKSSSLSEEPVLLMQGEVTPVPVVTSLVDLVRRGNQLLRSSDNIIRRVADVLNLDLAVVLITDDETVGAHHAEDASVQVVGLEAIVAVDNQ